MIKLEENKEEYLELFKDARFTELDFVSLLFPLLNHNGIYTIDEDELKKKLHCYYDKPEFNEIFADICLSKNSLSSQVDIEQGLFNEKYFGGRITWTTMKPNILHFHYSKNTDLSHYQEGLSENGIRLMYQIAKELAERTKIESQSRHYMNIYGCNPNKQYTLTHGTYLNSLLSWQLITDGNLKSLNYPDTEPFKYCFFDDPQNPNYQVQIDNNIIADITIQNASYAIMQALVNNDIRYLKVFTQISDPRTLAQISDIANTTYTTNDNLLVTEKPYIRKMKLN